MKKRYVICLVAAGALALAGSQADLLPRLTEDIVTRMLPVMRADVKNLEAAQAQLQEIEAEVIKDLQDFCAIRKSNLKIYQRLAAQVDPLLALLGK